MSSLYMSLAFDIRLCMSARLHVYHARLYFRTSVCPRVRASIL